VNPRVRQLWVDALRSGRFRQGQGILTRVGVDPDGVTPRPSHCCLGVLCQLAVEAGVALPVTVHPNLSGPIKTVSYDGSFHYLPDVVTEWAGLSQTDPEVNDHVQGGTSSLSSLNDRGESFDAIADAIEESL
jgi:hypothetical protein